MTAAAASTPEPGRPPFAEATPAQIRSALTPEDADAFDRHWLVLMQRATEDLDLTDVHRALDDWRQIAWVTSAHGVNTYRRTMVSAQERLRTGERAAGAVPWQQLRVELGLTE